MSENAAGGLDGVGTAVGLMVLRSGGYRALAALSRLAVAGELAPRGLRVLAYHDVPDGESLHDQISWVSRHFRVVTLDEALDGLRTGGDLADAVLITFDDGDPSVVVEGGPVLDSLDVKAVMFICPGMVDTREPFWWQVVHAAIDAGVELDGRIVTHHEVARLKEVSDDERRETVAKLRSLLEYQRSTPHPISAQVTSTDLRSWVAAGHDIGNHTWDHPMLDTCDPETQERQILAAHEWLQTRGLMDTPVFAYPNGNSTEHADSLLRQLGYGGAMMFDHRIQRARDSWHISRLRVNVGDTRDEFMARVSGVHPILHSLAGRK